MRLLTVGAVCVALTGCESADSRSALRAERLVAGASAGAPEIQTVASALHEADVYVDPSLSRLVDASRLRRAVALASRTADGAPIKLAFLNAPDNRLNGLRDGVFNALDLGGRGAVAVGTPLSITIRTRTLEPTAEQAIIDANGAQLRSSPRDYSETLSELVYDMGLVIHNSTPGVVPRGFGANSDLRTFTGRFEGEQAGSSAGWPVLVLLGAGAAGVACALAAARRRRARAPTVRS